MDEYTTIPTVPGDGVRFTQASLAEDVMRRINRLGKLEDRRKQYILKRQPSKLFALAREYEKGKGHQPMPEMAIRVRNEARRIRQQLKFEREALQK